MIHHKPTDLQCEDCKKILAYIDDRFLNLEHRIAFQNKAAAQTLLRPHEMNRIDEIMGTK